MANKIYCQLGYSIKKEFVHYIQENFLSEFEQLDIASPSRKREALGQINLWVNESTQNKIEEIITPRNKKS